MTKVFVRLWVMLVIVSPLSATIVLPFGALPADLKKNAIMKTPTFFSRLLSRDYKNYEGVRPIQIYLLRLVFTLTFVFIGMFSWTTIINFEGQWKPVNAVAFCMWAAYSTMSILGIIKPLKMLPIIALQIFYKSLWLSIVAYPLWVTGKLAGSGAEEMARDFMWIVLPIIAMPWGYFFRSFFGSRTITKPQALQRSSTGM